MKSSFVVLVSAVALFFSHYVAAQAPQPAGLIRDVASGQFVLVVKPDGSVIAWGHMPGGNLLAPAGVDLPGKALRVAAGESTAYALLEDGTVVAWGENDEGQLGNGASGANRELGRYPKPSITPVRVTGLADVVDIEAGRKHALALGKDGTVWAWGTRDEGALGGGDTKPAGSLRVVSALAPVAVPGLEGITQIAAGPTHNLALTRDGHVACGWYALDMGVCPLARAGAPCEEPIHAHPARPALIVAIRARGRISIDDKNASSVALPMIARPTAPSPLADGRALQLAHLLQPDGELIPAGAGLVHHPSLALRRASAR